jgi:hypothetical protein
MKILSDGVREFDKMSAVEAMQSEPQEEDELALLEEHLGVVSDKIRLCRELLQESPGIKEDELLADVIGYLEACSERMPEVIEAGAAGLLSESLFSEALRVNDALMRTLEAEKVWQHFLLIFFAL